MKVLRLGRWAFSSSFSHAFWLAGCLLAASPPSFATAADSTTAIAYKQADESVREALQREVYGLEADRQQLLAAAIASAPDHAAARWQLGYVRGADGQWGKADAKADLARLELLATYHEHRQKARDWPEEHLKLADWCAQQGLKDQERAHLSRVCQLTPDHEAARARLGFVRQGLEWITRDELARQEARSAAQKTATEKWTATLSSLLVHTASKKPHIRRLAHEQIKQIRDPAALPALNSLVATRGEDAELLVVEITAQLTDPEAAIALARHAVMSESARVRLLATTKLASYDHEQFVPQLVASLYTPITTQYNAGLANGRISYRHQLVREGLTRREMIVLDAAYQRASSNGFAAKAMALGSARETAESLEQETKRQNEATKALNERIVAVLRSVTGAELPAQPEAWWKWWTDQNEVFVEGAKPTATTQHFVSYNVVDRGLLTSDRSKRESLSSPIQPRYDCLAAGTPVWTEQGKVAIEQVRIGDLVLARDVESGELALKPVLRTTIRPAEKLIRVRAGSETFETSGGHLFWVSGEGWVKSRLLQSGMVLHTAAGPARISEVGEGRSAQTYNLVVADFNTYFVGNQKVLSHDNTTKRTTRVVVPGLKPE